MEDTPDFSHAGKVKESSIKKDTIIPQNTEIDLSNVKQKSQGGPLSARGQQSPSDFKYESIDVLSEKNLHTTPEKPQKNEVISKNKKKESPKVTPKKEELLKVEPKKQEQLKVTPEKKELPKAEPKKQEQPKVTPEKKELPKVEPKKQESPKVTPKWDDSTKIEPKKEEQPKVTP